MSLVIAALTDFVRWWPPYPRLFSHHPISIPGDQLHIARPPLLGWAYQSLHPSPVEELHSIPSAIRKTCCLNTGWHNIESRNDLHLIL
jgi:hypothetical protein